MKKCVIIAASPTDYKFNVSDSYVIASDGGYNTALKNNIKVDLLVGDLDSIDSIPNDVETIKFKKEKDETDTYLSIIEAIKRGYTDITLYGCIGGRSEHEFANYQILSNLIDKNIKCEMIDDNKKIFMLKENEEYKVMEKNVYISIFSYSEKSIVTINNLKYSGEDIKLSNSFPLGIDNEDNGDNGCIKVKEGKVLVFITKK